MITRVGDDYFGQLALQNFEAEGIDTRFVFTDAEAMTGAALIMVDENTSDNKIVVACGASGRVSEEDLEAARTALESCAILLTQLETNLPAVSKAVDIARRAGAKIILNPAPAAALPDELLRKIDILTPNETEAAMLTGLPVSDADEAGKAAESLLDRGVANVVITLGARGCLVVTRDARGFIPSIPVNCVDTTGAGDAYNGGLATALAEGKDIFEAACFANVVGALSVTKVGTAPAMPLRTEIDAELLRGKALLGGER
jgi:ribokinase